MKTTHRLYIPVQESDTVDGLYGFQYLFTQSECRVEWEAPARLTAPKLRQVATLQRHHNVVEFIVSAAAYEPTHMVFPWNVKSALKMMQKNVHTHWPSFELTMEIKALCSTSILPCNFLRQATSIFSTCFGCLADSNLRATASLLTMSCPS